MSRVTMVILLKVDSNSFDRNVSDNINSDATHPFKLEFLQFLCTFCNIKEKHAEITYSRRKVQVDKTYTEPEK